jgi:hypothetical protein
MPRITQDTMALDNLDTAAAQFEEDVARVAIFTNGDETEDYVTSDGRQVPSLSKVIANVNDMIAPDLEAIDAAVTASQAAASSASQNAGAAAASAGTASTDAAAAQQAALATHNDAIAAADDAERAEAAKDAASTARDEAVGAQTSVQQNADAANAAASRASASETAAAESVTQTGLDLAAVEELATEAAGSALAAGQSATQAGQSATAAGASATNAGASATQAAASAAQAGAMYRNLFHNARFQVNQRFYASGTAAPSAIFMTFDRWRIYVQGQAITSTSQGNGTYYAINCPAGGFEQVVDGIDIFGGQYVINWQGTATCQMGPVASPTTLVKGQVITLVAGTSMQFRFSNGTLWLPQLEPGTIPTVFEVIPYAAEIARCQAYFRVVTIDHEGYQAGGQNSIWSFHFPYMRKVPVGVGLQRGSSPNYANINSPPTFWLSFDVVSCTVPVTTTGTWFVVGYALGLSADL